MLVGEIYNRAQAYVMQQMQPVGNTGVAYLLNIKQTGGRVCSVVVD